MSDRACIIASRGRRAGVPTTYLCSTTDERTGDPFWSWCTTRFAAHKFQRNDALRHAKYIRRSWRVPARVEPA